MALWVVLLVLLVSRALQITPIMASLTGTFLLASCIALTLFVLQRRARMSAPKPAEERTPVPVEERQPVWASSLLLARPTAVQRRRHAGLPATYGTVSGEVPAGDRARQSA